VGVINNGELILVEDKAHLMRKLGSKQLSLRLSAPLGEIPAALEGYALELTDGGTTLTYSFDAKADATGVAALMRRLNETGVDFADLDTRQSSLEDIFVSLVSRKGSAA
jgi:ABC-2 type transport system ATP-binding protein